MNQEEVGGISLSVVCCAPLQLGQKHFAFRLCMRGGDILRLACHQVLVVALLVDTSLLF